MEVRSLLQRAEIGPDAIDATVRELVGYGYVDDARYARLFAQDRRTLDRWGADRIVRALRQRGVERDLITAALEDQCGDELGQGGGELGQCGGELGQCGGELGRAIALLNERFPAGPGSERDRSRAFGVLARKGYESEIAADAVRAWSRDGAR
jgi:regulatory protein